MSHYTLGYYDQQNEIHEMCEYAEDAFEAVKFAREDVPYLQAHPFSLHMIREVEWKTYLSHQPYLSSQPLEPHYGSIHNMLGHILYLYETI